MNTRHFKVLLEQDETEGVWVTQVPALDHISTYGASREQALANTREAILGYLEAAAKEGLAVPESEPTAELVDVEVAIA